MMFDDLGKLPVPVELLQLAQSLRPPKALPSPEVPKPPDGHVWCACKKKCILMQEVHFLDSKFVQGITDNICNECRAFINHPALIVCIHCRAVVSRTAAQRFDSGFVFEPDGVYHTDGCPNCQKGVQVTVLLEKVFFDHANKRPVKPEIMRRLKLK
jgi:hypothetical protein